MRPVNKGNPPLDSNGAPLQFKEYGDAKPYLKERLGHYCSYCEMAHATFAIEHVVPKNPKTGDPKLQKKWDNFLLACSICNSIKGHTRITIDQYYWPDKDNTFRAFVFTSSGMIEANPNLSPQEKTIAIRTMHLMGLDRTPFSKPPATKDDERHRFREAAWATALDAREDIQSAGDVTRDALIKWTIVHAKAIGFFSVWMTVFKDDADMRNRLIDAFPSTRASQCFNEQGNPQPRPGGRI